MTIAIQNIDSNNHVKCKTSFVTFLRMVETVRSALNWFFNVMFITYKEQKNTSAI